MIDVKNITKSFRKAELQDLLVLENINFAMKEGEIVFLGTKHELEQNNDSYVKRFVRHEE